MRSFTLGSPTELDKFDSIDLWLFGVNDLLLRVNRFSGLDGEANDRGLVARFYRNAELVRVDAREKSCRRRLCPRE